MKQQLNHLIDAKTLKWITNRRVRICTRETIPLNEGELSADMMKMHAVIRQLRHFNGIAVE